MNARSGLLLLTLSFVPTALAAPQDPVKFVGVLEQMRGHYDAMLLNLQDGNRTLALKHASHPANELYDLIKADLTPASRPASSRITKRSSYLGGEEVGR